MCTYKPSLICEFLLLYTSLQIVSVTVPDPQHNIVEGHSHYIVLEDDRLSADSRHSFIHSFIYLFHNSDQRPKYREILQILDTYKIAHIIENI